LNTHLPYGREAGEARRQSALLVLQQVAALPQDLPVLLTGDFNSPADGEVCGLLTGVLEDAWKTAQETRGPEGTMHGFGRITGQNRLDSPSQRRPEPHDRNRYAHGRRPLSLRSLPRHRHVPSRLSFIERL
jgi:hypothetical protein